jgi:hypothetical protein
MEIIDYIDLNWVKWFFTGFFAIISAILGYAHRVLNKKFKAQQKRNEAIADGVQALLRESIVTNYNKYEDRGYCPIYAKESLKKVYLAYHGLGGNDVATTLYHKILAMPEERKENEKMGLEKLG